MGPRSCVAGSKENAGATIRHAARRGARSASIQPGGGSGGLRAAVLAPGGGALLREMGGSERTAQPRDASPGAPPRIEGPPGLATMGGGLPAGEAGGVTVGGRPNASPSQKTKGAGAGARGGPGFFRSFFPFPDT